MGLVMNNLQMEILIVANGLMENLKVKVLIFGQMDPSMKVNEFISE